MKPLLMPFCRPGTISSQGRILCVNAKRLQGKVHFIEIPGMLSQPFPHSTIKQQSDPSKKESHCGRSVAYVQGIHTTRKPNTHVARCFDDGQVVWLSACEHDEHEAIDLHLNITDRCIYGVPICLLLEGSMPQWLKNVPRRKRSQSQSPPLTHHAFHGLHVVQDAGSPVKNCPSCIVLRSRYLKIPIPHKVSCIFVEIVKYNFTRQDFPTSEELLLHSEVIHHQMGSVLGIITFCPQKLHSKSLASNVALVASNCFSIGWLSINFAELHIQIGQL
mmetsp:Transcript_16242/g.37399  ORF Transcript_16242/g.37399 Transcript_16242/m.37399 type:complete len:275 (+) Transcript_16242:612-1436(+)